MLDLPNLKQIRRGVGTFAVCFVTLGIITVAGKEAYASTCFSHYNGKAWHGHGMALVFCYNSGGNNYPDGEEENGDFLPMKACEVRYRSSGKKALDFYQHIATDHGRQIFTDRHVPGINYAGTPLDIVCTGKNGKTYTYAVSDPASGITSAGVCSKTSPVGGDECVNDHNPILTVTKTGKGTGRITSNVAGDVSGSIYCLSNCKKDVAHYQYFSNKKVRLKATPDPGYAFLGWQGACKGSGYCNVTMNGDKKVVAKFGKAAIAPVNSLLMDEGR